MQGKTINFITINDIILYYPQTKKIGLSTVTVLTKTVYLPAGSHPSRY